MSTAVPSDAFAGDWLRQEERQYLVRTSSRLRGGELPGQRSSRPPPGRGCVHRDAAGRGGFAAASAAGNPLRPDPSRAEVWRRRVAQGPVVTLVGTAAAIQGGVAVAIQQVTPGRRAGVSVVELQPQWRWADPDPTAWTLEAGATHTRWSAAFWRSGNAGHRRLPVRPAGPGCRDVEAQREPAPNHPYRPALAAVPPARPFTLVGGTALLEPAAGAGNLGGPIVLPVGAGPVPVPCWRIGPTRPSRSSWPGPAKRAESPGIPTSRC